MSFFGLFKSPNTSSQQQDAVHSNDAIYDSYEEIESLPITISRQENKILTQMKSAGEAASKIGEFWIENKRINANIKALQIQTNASLEKHANYMLNMKDIVAKTFAERYTALNKHYMVLSRAIDSNDRELIIASLQGISSIVMQNPLENLAKIAFALKNPNQPLELDF